ncbi:GGDEF domain-containing protein [Candidatus Woesearchaeota archaeon]|nr:GGDEF domain-containing protein [Candidatus Woesearchaeota archaeon]
MNDISTDGALKEEETWRKNSHEALRKIRIGVELSKEEIKALTRMSYELRRIESENEDLSQKLALDPQTGLESDYAFTQKFEKFLSEIRKTGATNNYFFFLDIDNFKRVNDSLGHSVGDQLLRTTADYLVSTFKNTDSKSRRSGDEFKGLLYRIGPHSRDLGGDKKEAMIKQDKNVLELLTRLYQGYQMNIFPVLEKSLRTLVDEGLVNQEIQIPLVAMSVGVTRVTPDSSIEDVTRRADMAMYDVKSEGGNGVKLWESNLMYRD